MRVEYKKVVKVDELAHLIPTKAGATFSQLWQIFYYTRMLKYVTYRHYIQIKRSFNKICTYKNLQELCQLGYLKSPQHEVYCATNKVLPILLAAGYITYTLPPEPVGKGDINELNNTEAFINIIKQPYFYTLLYPNFGYVIPDALLVLINENKYKLTFIEVEEKKPQWKDNWLEDKRDNYLKLSKDINFYKYWKETACQLDLQCPDIKKLKFSVKFICDIKKDFEYGFSISKTV
jgi:hypothetical protein